LNYLENENIPEDLLSPEKKEEFTRFDDVDENGERQHYTLYSYPLRKVARPDRGFRMMDFLIRCSLIDRLALDSDEISDSWTPNAKVPSLRNRRFSGTFRASSICRSRRSTVGESVRRFASSRRGTSDLGRSFSFSSDPSVSMAYGGDIRHGVWAGDRFDIVHSDWLEGLEGDAVGWSDVSDEIYRLEGGG
jgi:hypothetical protein